MTDTCEIDQDWTGEADDYDQESNGDHGDAVEEFSDDTTIHGAPEYPVGDQYPDCLSQAMSVRNVTLRYLSFERRVIQPTNAQSNCPETMFTRNPSVCYMSRRFEPISWYPAVVTDNSGVPSGSVLVGSYIRLHLGIHDGLPSSLDKAFQRLQASELLWCVANARLEVNMVSDECLRVADLYRATSLPLHAYNVIAERELSTLARSEQGMWSSIYDACLPLTRRNGVYGSLMDNAAVEMRVFERNSSYSVQSDKSLREFKGSWNGFIDPGYTTANSDAGVLRCLVHRVQYRLQTTECMAKLRSLLMCVAPISGCTYDIFNARPGIWMIYMANTWAYTTLDSVTKVIGAWSQMRGIDTPSVHVFVAERIMTVSASSGCMMRPMSVSSDIGSECDAETQWVDSIVFNNEDMRRSLRVSGKTGNNPLEHSRTHLYLIPYTFFDESPRSTLGTYMSTQAICLPSNSLNSVNSPLVTTAPIVRTPLMNMASQSPMMPGYSNIPGIDLIVLYANDMRTYEDSVVMSSSVNRLGLFACSGTISHPVPRTARVPEVGSTVTSDSGWWRLATDGVVQSVVHTANRSTQVVARVYHSDIQVGDKVATCHGQKQTVSTVLPEDLMPWCTDVRTGARFKPHMIMASSSVHNRLTPGQIYESRAAMTGIDPSNYDPRHPEHRYVTAIDGSDWNKLAPNECTIQYPDSTTDAMSTLVVGSRSVVADYGVSRVWLLSHLARDKQHHSSAVPRGYQMPSGKLNGAPVKIGDMEIITMAANGMIHCLSEMIDSGDQCNVSICTRCSRLSMLCDCPMPKPDVRLIVTRASTVKLDICLAVYSLSMHAGTGGYASKEVIHAMISEAGNRDDLAGIVDLCMSVPTSFTYETSQ